MSRKEKFITILIENTSPEDKTLRLSGNKKGITALEIIPTPQVFNPVDIISSVPPNTKKLPLKKTRKPHG